MPNSNLMPNKWSANWITIYKSYSQFGAKVSGNVGVGGGTNGRYFHRKQHNDTTTTTTTTNNERHNNNGGQQHRKGKSNSTNSKCKKIRKSWSWKAGAGWTILSMLDWWLIAAGGWLTWRGLFLKWTPIGLGLVAAIHWHLRNQECDRKRLPRTASKWMVSIIIITL